MTVFIFSCVETPLWADQSLSVEKDKIQKIRGMSDPLDNCVPIGFVILSVFRENLLFL